MRSPGAHKEFTVRSASHPEVLDLSRGNLFRLSRLPLRSNPDMRNSGLLDCRERLAVVGDIDQHTVVREIVRETPALPAWIEDDPELGKICVRHTNGNNQRFAVGHPDGAADFFGAGIELTSLAIRYSNYA